MFWEVLLSIFYSWENRGSERIKWLFSKHSASGTAGQSGLLSRPPSSFGTCHLAPLLHTLPDIPFPTPIPPSSAPRRRRVFTFQRVPAAIGSNDDIKLKLWQRVVCREKFCPPANFCQDRKVRWVGSERWRDRVITRPQCWSWEMDNATGMGTPDRSSSGKTQAVQIHTWIWNPSGFSFSSIQDKVNQQC